MLRLTLASVRLQTRGDIEHIVVDGGSTDGTVELLQQAEQKWGVRWVSEADNGMYEALNKGLTMATGSVLGWVNSDDWLLPWTVDTAVRQIQSGAEPTAVYGDVVSAEPGQADSVAQVYGAFRRRSLAMVGTLAQPTVFWPRSATIDIGPLDTETYRQIADCDYWLRLCDVVTFTKSRELMAVVVNHRDTKRSSLAQEIADEFGQLRATHRPEHARPGWTKVGHAVRWRREVGRLMTGRDWPAARSSTLIDLPLRDMSPFRAMLRFGPHRRHPLRHLQIGIGHYLDQLESTARQLDG